MNLHYLIVSGTHIASPYLSSDIELLYGCYVVYDVINMSAAKAQQMRLL